MGSFVISAWKLEPDSSSILNVFALTLPGLAALVDLEDVLRLPVAAAAPR
ncbi:MAG: hypothetical protein ACYS9X_06640 [Planctomycetota bacterium]